MKYIYRTLITGGTGTIGRELARQMIGWNISIFSRNEKDQFFMKQQYPSFRYVIGDVRDSSAVLKACEGKDYVFHTASLKRVEVCEEEAEEAVKTNLIGSLNIINACRQYGCQMINMSTDKAINPSNVYGRTKSLVEAMVTQSKYVNIRSCNVLWSSGSVLPIWQLQLATSNEINLTSKEMTRFFIHPTELALFILSHKDDSGTFTVPMKAFRIYDIAERFVSLYGNKDSKINITGLRPGERLHEYMDDVISSDKNVCNDLEYIFKSK